MARASHGKGHHESGHKRTKPSLWEHAAAAVGAVVVIATIGFMIYEAATTPSDAVPQLNVRIDTVVSYPYGYVVEFRAINTGYATASNVQLRGELRGDTGIVERSEATIDFVPARSWREGGLVFQTAPAPNRLEVRVVGFDRP